MTIAQRYQLAQAGENDTRVAGHIKLPSMSGAFERGSRYGISTYNHGYLTFPIEEGAALARELMRVFVEEGV
jgi:hypothetical protein